MTNQTRRVRAVDAAVMRVDLGTELDVRCFGPLELASLSMNRGLVQQFDSLLYPCRYVLLGAMDYSLPPIILMWR